MLECRGPCAGPTSFVSACGVSKCICGLVSRAHSGTLGEFGRMGNVALLGFIKRKRPRGLRDVFLERPSKWLEKGLVLGLEISPMSSEALWTLGLG